MTTVVVGMMGAVGILVGATSKRTVLLDALHVMFFMLLTGGFLYSEFAICSLGMGCRFGISLVAKSTTIFS